MSKFRQRIARLEQIAGSQRGEIRVPIFTPEEEEEIVSILASASIWEPMLAGEKAELGKLSTQQLERLLELYEAEDKREKERL